MKSVYKAEKEIAKNGSVIPVFENGRLMHSRYNPEAEAQKMADINSRYTVVIGLGGGYHIQALLQKNPEMKIIVVESSEDDFAVLQDIPCVKAIFETGNVVFCTKKELSKTLLSSYIPIFHGDLGILSQRAWAQNFPDAECEIRAIINATLKNIAADFSVQAHFGRHWHRNIFQNLKYAATHTLSPLPMSDGKTAAVIAAGPSLDKSLSKIAQMREKYFVIACDTAFSALTRRGINADAVVSIDAQNVSHRHFFHFPENPPLCVFDLGAPHSSVLAAEKSGAKILFSSSMHPLSVLAREFGDFPYLESGAGTVAIAASDFARISGFDKIELFGADFSYSRGKPYASGTYFDDIFGEESNRLRNSETAFDTLMFRTPLIKKENGVFSTEMLEKYASTTADFFAEHAFVQQEKNLYCATKKAEPRKESARLFSFDKFTKELLCETEKLLLEKNPEKYRAAFFAHLPVMAAMREKNIPFFDLLKLAYESSVRYTK